MLKKYYIEDFQCFRHYVLNYDEVKNEKIIPRLVSFEKNAYTRGYDKDKFEIRYNETNEETLYYKVIIFNEIPKIRLNLFYKELYNRNFYMKNKAIGNINPKGFMKIPIEKFHYTKINRNWIVSNISEEYTLKDLNGNEIKYRLADILVKKEDTKEIK
jgi:hypothetical protein